MFSLRDIFPKEMMDARWQYFRFDHAFSQADIQKVEACPCCYAKWISAGQPEPVQLPVVEPGDPVAAVEELDDPDHDVRWGLP